MDWNFSLVKATASSMTVRPGTQDRLHAGLRSYLQGPPLKEGLRRGLSLSPG